MKKKMRIVIKPEDVHTRNELHFEVQRNTRMHIQKPKKGKGSFSRKRKHKKDDI
jgi:stalled ribosome alternative rescue factor ArfA